jgi:DNA-binding GntR family transcriptional regulator
MTIRTLAERYIMPEDVLPEVKRTSQQQHHLIYRAIFDQGGALAAIRMREHLQLSYEVYRQAIPRANLGRTSEQLPAEERRSDPTRINPRLR